MRPTILSSAVLLSLALPGLAQDSPTLRRTAPAPPTVAPPRAPLPAPASALTGLGPNRTRVHYDEPGDGSIWARGGDYKAGFDARGAQFVPYQGPESPSRPVRFAPVRVRAGGAALAVASDVVPVRDGARVSFDRGSVTEVYELAPKGMEQMFVFHTPTPDGALVLHVDVETNLVCSPDGEGLRFDGARGGVRYGAATVLDAAGRSAPAPLDWTGDGLEIRVPAGFLADATWPVTVDPLVFTFILDDFVEGLFLPDGAFDVTTDSYLVVYEEIFSSSDVDVYFRQVDAGATTILAEGYVNATDRKWQVPRVANNNGADRFLVVAQEEQNASSHTVVSRTIDATGGVLGIVEGVDGTELVDQIHPDVGGDLFDGQSIWIVVWTEDDQLGREDIKWRRIGADGLPIGTAELLTSDTELDERASISNSAGSFDGATNSSFWTIVWRREDAVGTGRIYGAQVSWTGALHHSPFFVGGFDASEPSVSSILDGSGDDRTCMVVWQQPNAGSSDVHAAVCVGDSVVLLERLIPIEGGPEDHEQTLPSVDSDGERFIVAYAERPSFTSSDDEVYMSTYALAGSNLCPSENRVRVTNDPIKDTLVEVTTDYSGGGGRLRTLAVWSRYTSPLDANVLGALYDAGLPDCLGTPYCGASVPNSSGQGARLVATGSRFAGGNPLTLHATRLPTFQFGYFITGMTSGAPGVPPGSQGNLCIFGSIARLNRPGEIQFSGASGAFDLAVDTLDIPLTPPVAIQPGETWHFQAWVRDMNPTSTSNFTNGLRIRFE